MRIAYTFIVLLIVALGAISCDDDSADPQGSEGAACYPNQTCDTGLDCISGLCVNLTANCGNEICESWEDAESCPEDCGEALCGNASCEPGETPESCPEDCAEALCGNNVIEGLEVCDGTNLDSATCDSLGLGEGILTCLGDCSDYDTADCRLATCGDDNVEGAEVCDGTNLNGATCESETGLLLGQLLCEGDCLGFDTSECHTCGDGIISGPEVCDGTNLGGETCSTQGFAEGFLLCSSDCLDFTVANCGSCNNDGVCDPDERAWSCPADCSCPVGQECADYTGSGDYACLENHNLPAGAETGCDTAGCSIPGFSCTCLNSACTGSTAVCLEMCDIATNPCNYDGICGPGEDINSCPADCTCPSGQQCEDLTGSGNYGCVENGAIPPGAETGCDATGCSSEGYSCYCIDANCSGASAVCIEDC
ncbi:hypothetical protein KKF84_08170 [Myxococcota bacterium]|nr:hypothetical protein [Myxococcota bacterium]MBU1535283.1 hypothetical protein [Myxococcota bacterium]